jgi:tRNA A37 threonylcarbamoyladenosine dehydratase
MDKTDAVTTREERLAAKLRENLRRRKAQARDKAADKAPPLPKSPPNG